MDPLSPPPLRNFPDAAMRWILESPANVRGLLLAVAPEIADRIAYGRLRALPRTFIQTSFREREADLVLRAPYRARDGSPEREVWIYLLLEHQSSRDPLLPFRLLFYMVQLWEAERREQEEAKVPDGQQRLSPILPVVVYTGRREWDRLGSLAELCDTPPELGGFLPRFDCVFFNVGTAGPERLEAGGDPFGGLLRLLHDEAAPAAVFKAVVEDACRRFRGLQATGDPERWWRLTWFVVGLILHRRPSDEQAPLLEVVRQAIGDAEIMREVEVMAKTYAEDLIERGMAIGAERERELGKELGLELGKEIGRTHAKRETLLELMRLKFGPLPAEVEARVAGLSDIARLDELLRLILTAGSLAEMGL